MASLAKHDVHFSSQSDLWETPDDLFRRYDRCFDFVLDAAANEVNHKCSRWFGPGGEVEDALTVDWRPILGRGSIWLNPPYSKGSQAPFVAKAQQTVQGTLTGHSIVCLLPARTDTKLFHDTIKPFGRIEFLRGRVKFVGAAHGAPFPSMIVVFE